MKNFNIFLFSLTLLIIIPFVPAPANYGAGTYGSGAYGIASCGDAVCESGETCSSCSSDCGVCATSQVYGVIINYTFTEKIRSWVIISPGGTVIMNNFEEDYGINNIRLLVGDEATRAKITVRKYHAKPEDVFIEAPGIVYKYLQIETENFETLEKATVNIEVLDSWASEHNVETEDISLYKFDNSTVSWNKLETNFVNGNGNYSFYDTVLTSFSFFAISGESETPIVPGADLIPEEIDEFEILDGLGEFNLLWIVSIILMFSSICLLIVIIIISKEKKDLEFLKSKQRYEHMTRPH